MPQDSAVTLALITASAAAFASLVGLAGVALGYWNNQRQWNNQRVLLEQQRKWDKEDRATRHEETKSAISVVGAKADNAYNEANHTKEQIIKLHEENNAMHRDIGAVLEVAKAVKHSTGQHKPLEKSEISALAKEVVIAIRATGPLTSSGD